MTERHVLRIHNFLFDSMWELIRIRSGLLILVSFKRTSFLRVTLVLFNSSLVESSSLLMPFIDSHLVSKGEKWLEYRREYMWSFNKIKLGVVTRRGSWKSLIPFTPWDPPNSLSPGSVGSSCRRRSLCLIWQVVVVTDDFPRAQFVSICVGQSRFWFISISRKGESG